jgi:hypothetical protein
MKLLLPRFNDGVLRGNGGGTERLTGGGLTRLLKERPPLLDLASASSVQHGEKANSVDKTNTNKTDTAVIFILFPLFIVCYSQLVTISLLC